jgi:hypothetical protein
MGNQDFNVQQETAVMKRIVFTGLMVSTVASLAITAAVAGSGVGGVFNLGQVNTVGKTTVLRGKTPAQQLTVVNGAATNTATAVQGQADAGVGVVGRTATRTGVLGAATATTGLNFGVFGSTASPDGFAGYFRNLGSADSPRGGRGIRGLGAGGDDEIFPEENFAGGGEFAGPNGVVGYPTFAEGAGVAGFTGDVGGVGVYGASTAKPGVAGLFRNLTADAGPAVRALADGSGDQAFANLPTAAGEFAGKVGLLGIGSTTGVWARSTSDIGFALFAQGRMDVTGNAEFRRNVAVSGTLTKGSGTFKIDHPLDPENRYLSHSFVESPDMKNVYDGVAVTDDTGRAIVDLPDYFEALNRDPRYQLTVIGAPADSFPLVRIAEGVNDNRFVIRTSEPGVKVSWQVTGIRRDAFAVRNPVVVEEEKSMADRGRYLHPEAFGQPASLAIGPDRDVLAVRQ